MAVAVLLWQLVGVDDDDLRLTSESQAQGSGLPSDATYSFMLQHRLDPEICLP